MSNSYTHAATLFGRRIRIAYIVVLVLLFLARMWSVYGVHRFLALDAGHGEMAGIAGGLPGQSLEVAHAAFIRAYAPQKADQAADLLDRAIGNWRVQHAKVARLLARLCAGDKALCVRFDALNAQMLAV